MTKSDEFDLLKVAKLLSGVDMTNLEADEQLVWIKSTASETSRNSSLKQVSETAFVFSAIPIDRPYLQLLGDLGTEGDEAVFADGIIVETCSLSGINYIEILAPTYISFETKADEQQLQDLLAEFKETGKLATCFIHPGILFELAGFAPRRFTIKRTIIDEEGDKPWSIPPVIEKAGAADPELCRYFAGAVILSRRVGDAEARLTFEIPEYISNEQTPPGRVENVILARTDTEYLCLDLNTGKIFSIGYDMYRAILSVLRPTKYATLPGEPLQPELIDQALSSLQGKLQKVK